MSPYRRSSRVDAPSRPRRPRRVAGHEPAAGHRPDPDRARTPESERVAQLVPGGSGAREPLRSAGRPTQLLGEPEIATPAPVQQPVTAVPWPRSTARVGADVWATDWVDRTAGGRRRRRLRRLAVAFVLLVGVAAVGYIQVRDTPAAQSTALVDVAATAQVASRLGDDLAKVYSYDFARLDQNEADARAVITPEFAAQLGQLFGQVRLLAPQQQAVVTATVTSAAVQQIQGDRASVLVFLDQQVTRAGDAEPISVASRLMVTGERVGGQWKIAGVQSH